MMVEKIKEGDVVEIFYAGYSLPGDVLFDTNIKEVAKRYKNQENGVYDGFVIVVGKGMVVKGLDDALINKEIGKEYEIEISPENAFGTHDLKKIKLLPMEHFLAQKITPRPGMVITFDNNVSAKILSVSGGRVKVDFNHPLAGKRIKYQFKITRKITSPPDKFKGLVKTVLGISIKDEDMRYDPSTKILSLSKKYKKLKDFLENIIENLLGKDEIKEIRIIEEEKEVEEIKKK